MALPLLALPDAPQADEARTGPPLQPAEWEANRLACLTEEERNRAAERTPTAMDTAEEMTKFIIGAFNSNTCECNMEEGGIPRANIVSLCSANSASYMSPMSSKSLSLSL